MMMRGDLLWIVHFIVLFDFTSCIFLSQSNMTTEPGKGLAISCRDEAGQPVTWKGPKGLLSANTKPKVQDTSIGKLLVFGSTKVHDSGNYTCSLMSNKHEFRTFMLVVEDNRDRDSSLETETSTIDHPQIRPRYDNSREKDSSKETIQFKDTSEVQRGKEGDNITLRCEVNKPYKIIWVLDENEIKLGSRYVPIGDGLVIIDANRLEDNRTFVCEAVKSSLGKIFRKKIDLIIEYEPEPVTYAPDPETGEVHNENEKVYGFPEGSINLTCEVKAEPPAIFEWRGSRRGYRKLGKYYNIPHKSILQLKVSKQTLDLYECTARNKHGNITKNFDLQFGTRPIPPGKIELVKTGSDHLELKVEVPEQTEEDIINGMEARWMNIFYRNVNSVLWDEQIFNITLETFDVTGLNSSTKYEIIAACRNVAGLSNHTNSSYFETQSANGVQINNMGIFSLAIINILLLST